MKKIKYILASMVLLAGLCSCVKDLERDPIDPNIYPATEALKTADDFYNFLAGIYTGFATSGYYGVDGSASLSGLDGGMSQYFRGLFHLQELTTDESLCGWNDEGVPDMHAMSWTTENGLVYSFYSRIFYQISLCNEFIRQANASSVEGLEPYVAEARTLRALCYLHGIDCFGNCPFIDENAAVGDYPEQLSRSELFDWMETELKDILVDSKLAEPRKNEYGRADKGLAKMILAKLYLNAEVYTGKSRYDDCADVCLDLLKDGYSLHGKFQEMFMADNDKCTDEIIFAVEQNYPDTQSWGATTSLIRGSVGGSMKPEDFGIKEGWGGYRATPEYASLFEDADARNLFWTDGQSSEIEILSEFTQGYPVTKFTNLNSKGQAGRDGTYTYNVYEHVDTDLPVFRYSDVYLMLAECAMRGSSKVSTNEGLGYLNMVRSRAGVGDATTLDENTIIDERGREFCLECWRRSDLIRFGRFTGNTYTWSWKAGTMGGDTNVPEYRNLFPIPAKDIQANDKLTQNPGY